MGGNITSKIFILAFALILLLPTIAFAQPCSNIITSCGCTLDSSGAYTLNNDISMSGSDTCLEIRGNSVMLEGNGHKISGDGTAGSTGINLIGSVDSTLIEYFNITGFDNGIYFGTGNMVASVIRKNNIYGNRFGIFLTGSVSSCRLIEIYDNRIIDNSVYGLALSGCKGNYIYNNFFNNPTNAYDDSGNNYYSTTKTLGTNIIDGSYIGGNYWSDYDGIDTNGDGLGDTKIPYNSNGNIMNGGGDNLPLVDINSPTYSNIITNPTNPVYSPSATYEFKITWTDNIAVDKVILEFNGANYTDLTKNGNVYSRIFTGLSAGNYQYKWYANDTANNWASTNSLTYTITRATPTCTLNSLNDWNYGYGASTTLSCSCSGDGTTHLYFDNILHDDYNNNAEIFSANPSGHSVQCNITEGTNYNSASDPKTLTISKGTPTLSLTPSKSINYGTAAGMTGSTSDSGNGGCTYTLYRNGSPYVSGTFITDNTVLAAGSYPYVYNTSGCTNYTSGTTTTSTLTVVPPPIVTIISPASPYHKISVPLNVTIDRPSMISYSLDGQTNVTNISYVTSYFKLLTGLANGNHSLIVYATDSSGNTGFNTTNFSYCYADVNDNKAVDLPDLVILANAYGSKPGDAKWNPAADINDNKVVDLADLVLLAKYYGNRC